MQTRSTTAALLLTTTVSLTLTLTVACAPAPGTCADPVDCAFGQVCSDEGLCVGASGGDLRPRDGGIDVDMANASPLMGGLVSRHSSTGRFTGRIGGAELDVANVQVEVYAAGITVMFKKPEATSTFLVVQSSEAFASPGTRTVTTGLDTEVAQACNYDTAAYDEWFPTFEVVVSPPRDVTADDAIIAEDQPTTVVDVKVAVAGEGSDVGVDFVLPTP
jgi:hypothetical protein